MASLRSRNGVYVVCFRFGGRQLNYAAGADFDQADARRKPVEAFLLDPKTGREQIPESADPGRHIFSTGKLTEKPVLPEFTMLGELFRRYQTERPAGAREDNTRTTERVHVGHLERILGGQLALAGTGTGGNHSSCYYQAASDGK